MAMDPVNKKALKKDFKNRKDQDIDNDGDVDSSDEYLHARRKAVSKAIKNVKESLELDEAKADVYHKHMLKALGKSRLPKNHSYTSAIANNGDFIVRDGGGRVVGRIEKGDHNLKESLELAEATFSMDIDYNYEKRLEAGAKKAGLGVKFVQHGGATEMILTGDKDKITRFLKARRVPASEISNGFIKESVELEEKVYSSDYNVGHEKSQFGGYRPHVTHKKTGKTMYLGQTSYKTPEHAKGHAAAYLKGYEQVGDRTANRHANAYEKANKQHVYKEEVELDESDKQSLKKHIEKLKKMYKDEEQKNKARKNPYSSPKMSQIAQAISEYEKQLKEEVELEEKAESQAQAIAARIALKHKREGTKPEAGTASADMMKMSEKDLEDYTKAKKGAPEKVQEANMNPAQKKAIDDYMKSIQGKNISKDLVKASVDAIMKVLK